MIQKQTIAKVFLTICLLIGLDVFWLTPLTRLASGMGLGLSLMGYVVFLFYFKKFPRPLQIFGILFALLFIQSIISPIIIYDQTFIEGILSSSALITAGVGLLFYFVTVKYRIKIEFISRRIRTIAWLLFSLYVIMHFTESTFTIGNSKEFGVQSFKKTTINLAAFIYLTRFFRDSNFRYLFFSVLLLSISHLEDFQRVVFFLSIFSFGLLLYSFRRNTAGFRFLISLTFIIPLFGIILNTTNLGETIIDKTNDALEIFETERDNYTEASVGARVIQSEYAIGIISKYPVTGVGKLNNDNKEEITGLSYFYISDIGLIGVMYSFGILGILIYLIQVYYWISYYSKKGFAQNEETIPFKIFLFFLLVHSIFSGISVIDPVSVIILIALIEIGRMNNKLELNDNENTL